MKTDVVIIGGGPGGAAMALFLAKEGIDSIIVEKESFPRYHIGESLTTECGNYLRELGLESVMLEANHPRKRGVKVFGPEANGNFYVPVMSRNAEGELVDTFTWQVRRSEFDKMLLDQAIDAGVEILKGRAEKPLRDGDTVTGVLVRTEEGELVEIHSKVVVDASGQQTFLSTHGVTGPKERYRYDNQVAIFSQVRNTLRDEDLPDDTLILYREQFHWAWFIPLDDDVVSVGVNVPTEYFRSRGESKEDFLRRELGELNPELARRIPDKTLVEDVRAISNYSYHIREYTGKGYMCIGDSHRFIDPIFSFGVTFAIAEAKKGSQAIAAYVRGESADADNPFADFQEWAERGQDVIQDLIDAFWGQPLAFAFFAHHRYVEDFVDMFAARIYKEEPSRGLSAIHTILAQTVPAD